MISWHLPCSAGLPMFLPSPPLWWHSLHFGVRNAGQPSPIPPSSRQSSTSRPSVPAARCNWSTLFLCADLLLGYCGLAFNWLRIFARIAIGPGFFRAHRETLYEQPGVRGQSKCKIATARADKWPAGCVEYGCSANRRRHLLHHFDHVFGTCCTRIWSGRHASNCERSVAARSHNCCSQNSASAQIGNRVQPADLVVQ